MLQNPRILETFKVLQLPRIQNFQPGVETEKAFFFRIANRAWRPKKLFFCGSAGQASRLKKQSKYCTIQRFWFFSRLKMLPNSKDFVL